MGKSWWSILLDQQNLGQYKILDAQILIGHPDWWLTRWWFQTFFYVHPYSGKIPSLTSIFLRWVETINQLRLLFEVSILYHFVIKRDHSDLVYTTWAPKIVEKRFSGKCPGYFSQKSRLVKYNYNLARHYPVSQADHENDSLPWNCWWSKSLPK